MVDKIDGYIVISKGREGGSLTHWGIGNPFKESAVKRDGSGQFARVKSTLSNLADKAFDTQSISLYFIGDTGYATLEDGDGANKMTREFEVTQFPGKEVNFENMKSTDAGVDNKGRFYREVEEGLPDGNTRVTRVVMTKSKNLSKDRKTASNFINEKEFDDLAKKMPKDISIKKKNKS